MNGMVMSPRSFSGYRSLWWLSLLSLYVKRSNVKRSNVKAVQIEAVQIEAVQIEAVEYEAGHLKRSHESRCLRGEWARLFAPGGGSAG
ncbi:hypothetical protein [Schauerella aestuarii]|uniref:hypothetical protein n=1 Tax=Schauerella aestuarii TaxID=2511204 RepID=UPI00136C5E6D|nr:hypothetical protein [Achromobacter aestuarii]MYZ42085.1 hypothetical protein [Achromobacter aestuarii]